MSFGLHASHAALSMLTLKFRPKVSPLPSINIKMFTKCRLPKANINIQNCARISASTLLNFSPCSTFLLTFSTSKRLTFTKPIFTRRTSGHCLGTFVAPKINFCPPPVKNLCL
jgi:hypothetical protein